MLLKALTIVLQNLTARMGLFSYTRVVLQGLDSHQLVCAQTQSRAIEIVK